MNGKVWGGRFREKTDGLVHHFNASIHFDRRLYAEDIDGSIAHVEMLAKQGILSDEETSRIVETLEQIRRDLEHDRIPIDEDYEDIHGLVEKVLIERIGAAGEKLHTGRSRNDQVALDTRLYVRKIVWRFFDLIRDLQHGFVAQAERHADLIMPGYTHMQRAQPVLLAHHLLAYYEMLKRDRERYGECLRRVNRMPLGSAALAGSTFDLDRAMVAESLGFEDICMNSMDAVSDRDFILDFLYASSVLMMHLSRFAEELILWSSQEFGFLTISDAFCTGSSIMPQKKNPDVPELIRGKTGRVYGHLMALLTTMKGLPLSYNKDMQEDKEALFDTVDTLEMCLRVLGQLLSGLSFHGTRMKEATEQGYLVATDLADYLVRRGIPFREAHGIVGKMVLYAMDRHKELKDLRLEEMKDFSNQIEEEVYEWLDCSSTVRRRNLPGGTGPERVMESLQKAKEELAA